MKIVNPNNKKNENDLKLLNDHIKEHGQDMKHAILITYDQNNEMMMTYTGMEEIEFLGILELAKGFVEEINE